MSKMKDFALLIGRVMTKLTEARPVRFYRNCSEADVPLDGPELQLLRELVDEKIQKLSEPPPPALPEPEMRFTERFGTIPTAALVALQTAEAGNVERDAEIVRLRDHIDWLLDTLVRQGRQMSDVQVDVAVQQLAVGQETQWRMRQLGYDTRRSS